MNVAKEVHVGSPAVQAFVLHQELTEQHLRFVFLPHNLQLSRAEKRSVTDFQHSWNTGAVTLQNLFTLFLLSQLARSCFCETCFSSILSNLLQLHFKAGVCVYVCGPLWIQDSNFLYINCSIALGVQCMGPFVQCFL